MTIIEKQSVAAYARELINSLRYCEDEEFIDLIVECIITGDAFPLKPENLK